MGFHATYIMKVIMSGCLLITVYYILHFAKMGSPAIISIMSPEQKSRLTAGHLHLSTSLDTTRRIAYHNGPGYGTLTNPSKACPIRDIVKTLHGPNTSVVAINTALKELRYCKTIYFTSVPKCATQTTIRLFKSVEIENNFTTFNCVARPCPPPTSDEYLRKVSNHSIYSLHRREANYVNFTKYGFPSPVYISLIRHPVERLVSLYHYRIFGLRNYSEPQPPKAIPRHKHCEKITIDEIVNFHYGSGRTVTHGLNKTVANACWPPRRIVTNFFCDKKWQFISEKEGLKTAWRAVSSDYLIVGIQEELDLFFKCIDRLMPSFFRGIYHNYQESESELRKTFKTALKREIKPETNQILEQILKIDIEFYERVKQRFHALCDKYV